MLEQEPWIEKYRPKTISEVRDQGMMEKLFENNDKMMHLLLYGPPGTGKTSSILAFCKTQYTGKKWDDCILEINASVMESISLNEKIKSFCKKSFVPFENKNGNMVNFKMIILDEADSINSSIQHSIKRLIEIYSYNTRFCFLCNYINKIIIPITSRCYMYHFNPIEKSICLNQMKYICQKEDIEFKEDALNAIYEHHEGDMRSCISTLQGMFYMNDKVVLDNFVFLFKKMEFYFFEKAMQLKDITSIIDFCDTEIYQKGIDSRTVLESAIQWCMKTQNYDINDKFSRFAFRFEKECMIVKNTRLLIIQIFSYLFFLMKI